MPSDVTVTYLAFILLALALAVILLPKQACAVWLFLFPITAVLQVPAALIVQFPGSKAGISPFQLWGGLAYLIFLAHYASRLRNSALTPRNLLIDPLKANKTLGLLLGFFAYSILTALTLPFLFEGLPLHLLGRIEGDTIPPEPLRFNLGHIAQIINTLCLIALALLILMEKRAFPALAWGTLLAMVVSILATLAQRLAVLGYPTHWPALYPHNPSYNQHYGPTAPMQDPWIERTSLPFIEPSYATSWFAAVAIVGWILAIGLLSRLHFRASPRNECLPASRASLGKLPAMLALSLQCAAFLLLALLAVAAVLSTRGSTGLVALAAAIPIVLGLLLIVKQLRTAIVAFAFLAMAAIASGTVGLKLMTSAQQSHVQQAITSTIQKTREYFLLDSRADDAGRIASNKKALELFASTYGIGVGLGSHRPSGYFHALLANLGIVGLAWFVTILSLIGLRLIKRIRQGADSISSVLDLALLGGAVPLLIAVAGGIPDLNWPVWWLLIMLLIAREAQVNSLS